MHKKSLYQFLGILFFITLWSVFLFFIGPSRIVEFIGTDNTLVVVFFLAAMGGVSTLTGVYFFSTIVALALGGVDPYYLGIVAGIGVTIGDSLFYYLGRTGNKSLVGKPKQWSQQLSLWLQARPPWMIPFITFIYVGFTPFPNDILTVALGFTRCGYKRIIVPLLLGNIFLTTLITVLASRGLF